MQTSLNFLYIHAAMAQTSSEDSVPLFTSNFVDDVTFAHNERGKGDASWAYTQSESPGCSTRRSLWLLYLLYYLQNTQWLEFRQSLRKRRNFASVNVKAVDVAAVWALDRFSQEDLDVRVVPGGAGHDAVHVKLTTPWHGRDVGWRPAALVGRTVHSVQWKQVSCTTLSRSLSAVDNCFFFTSDPFSALLCFSGPSVLPSAAADVPSLCSS